MEEGKREKIAQEAVRNREMNEGDFNLFLTQSTTALETDAEPRFQTHWQSLKWSQTSSDDSQTSTDVLWWKSFNRIDTEDPSYT